MPTTILSIILVIISSIIAGIGGFLFKGASKNLSLKFRKLLTNYKLILGFLFFGLAVIVYIIALKNGELNVIYPISSLTYVWSTLLAKKYLKEKINIYKWFGIALILLGAFFVTN